MAADLSSVPPAAVIDTLATDTRRGLTERTSASDVGA
jgi:hypothetical protein